MSSIPLSLYPLPRFPELGANEAPTERGRLPLLSAPLPVSMLAILDRLHDGVLITTFDDTIVFANQRIVEMSGFSEAELVGTPAYQLMIPSEHWPDMTAHNERRRRGESEVYEMPHLRRDGSLFVALVKASPLYDDHGQAVYTIGIIDDITDQRRAEQALRQSEAHFRSAFDNAAIGMTMVGPDFRFVDVNEAFCRMLGYERAELLHLTVPAVSLPEDMPENARLIRQAVAGEIDSYSLEKRFRHKNGKIVWANVTASVVRGDDGKTRYVIGQVLDLSARKRAEEARQASERALAESMKALRTSEERYRLLADSIEDVVTLQDEEMRILYVSPSVTRHTGWLPEEIVGHLTCDFMHPDDKERVLREGTDQRTRLGSSVLEWRQRRRDGSYLLVESRSRLIPASEERGTAAMVVSASRDITDRREQREKLRRMMQGARCLIWEAEVQQAAPDQPPLWKMAFGEEDAARRWLPVKSEPGQSFLDSWLAAKTPEDCLRMDATSEHALRAGLSGYEQEFRCHLADGSIRWLHEDVHIQLPVYITEEGVRHWHVVGVCTDITDRKRIEEQMIRHEKLAALGELVAGIAHEVNNPLAAVSGHAQLLALHPDSAVQEDAKAIRSAADRASRILRSLLTFARQGGGETSRRTVALNAVVETCEDLVRAKLRRSDVQLTLTLTPETAMVQVNETQIEQVLVNLVNNAEYALRSDESEENRCIEIRTAVEVIEPVRGSDTGQRAIIDVIDNGPGMTPEIAARIFDPFFTTKQMGEGTGLGLSLCHGILESHGGKITLERTAPAQGTAFRLSLPLVPPLSA